MIKEQTVKGSYATENTSFKMEEVLITATNGYKFYVTVLSRPMGNCQFFSIGYFCNLLYYELTPEDIKKFVLDYAEKYERKMLLIDIQEKYIEKTKAIYPNVKIYPYTNSNGSAMAMCHIQVRY